MDKTAFARFGTFVTAFRCLLAFGTIVQSALAMDMKNRLTGPVREWLSCVIFYSISASLFVLSVTAVNSADYADKNLHRYKKIVSTKQSLKLKSYVVVAAVETIVIIWYCANLQVTLQTASEEIEHILTTSLKKYSTNSSWRLFWDQFQQHYSCCGSSQNTDWFQTAWVSPIDVPFSLLKKYTQPHGKFIIPAAPISCCLSEVTCDTFEDCEQPDPNKYSQISCYSVIADRFNSIASSRYLFYAVIVIQIIFLPLSLIKDEFAHKYNTKLELPNCFDIKALVTTHAGRQPLNYYSI